MRSAASAQHCSVDAVPAQVETQTENSSRRKIRTLRVVDDYFEICSSENRDRLWLPTYCQPSGVTLSAKSTQYAFGVNGGINAPVASPLASGDTFKYTGRNEYGAILDLEKLAGFNGGQLQIRLEHWYGQYGNVSLNTGAFAPAVLAAELPPVPNDPGIPVLTGLAWTQPLSERLVVYFGKTSGIGAADQNLFAGGDGTDQFSNMALLESPALLLGIPYSSFSAGLSCSYERFEHIAYLYDATDRTADFLNVGDLFSQGVIVGSELRSKTNLFGLPGQHHVGAVWKHVPLTDLAFAEPPPGVYPDPAVPGSPTLKNSFTLYYGFDQFLVRFLDDDRGWGLFGRASISDGNPTPVRYFLSVGFGGDSRLRPDKNDRWGIGWYYVGVSNQFGPVPQAEYGPRDGTGVELYYNIQVTTRLNLTPDIQLMRPEASALADRAFVYGLRANLSW
jgi:porin